MIRLLWSGERNLRRVYNVSGTITDGARGDYLEGPVTHWVEELTHPAVEVGMDSFVFSPLSDPTSQVRRFAEEVMPAVLASVVSHRGA